MVRQDVNALANRNLKHKMDKSFSVPLSDAEVNIISDSNHKLVKEYLLKIREDLTEDSIQNQIKYWNAQAVNQSNSYSFVEYYEVLRNGKFHPCSNSFPYYRLDRDAIRITGEFTDVGKIDCEGCPAWYIGESKVEKGIFFTKRILMVSPRGTDDFDPIDDLIVPVEVWNALSQNVKDDLLMWNNTDVGVRVFDYHKDDAGFYILNYYAEAVERAGGRPPSIGEYGNIYY